MGFEKSIITILRIFSSGRDPGIEKRLQSILCSATLSGDVQRLADLSLENPKFITTQQLQQFFVETPAKKRLVTLAAFMRWKSREKCKMIVFASTTMTVNFLETLFGRTKIPKKQTRIDQTELKGFHQIL